MTKNPFGPLIARRNRKASLRRLANRLGRPWRPSRVLARRSGPPNLIMIGVDTLRADHLGAWGHGRPTSPCLDQQGGRGTLFTQVSACAPWTLPSFAGALTGVMPGLHGAYLPGVVRNMDTQPPLRLQQGRATLATHLKARGYRTAAFYSNPFFAFGLAESFGHHRYLNDQADEVIRVALDWIRRHGDRPFFCFILLNDPHEPTTPEPRDLAPFLNSAVARGAMPSAALLRGLARWGENPAPDLGMATEPLTAAVVEALAVKSAIYDATIHQVDRAIGALAEQIERWDLSATTMQTVFSDHGEEFLDHVAWARRWNHDPRGLAGIGHGHTLLEELLHVPWLSWGAGVPAGVRRHEPASLLDLAPTLLDWLGLPALPETPDLPADLFPLLTGRSLARPAPESDPAEARIILSEAIAYGPDLVSVRRGRWKLVAHRDGRPLALFDLEMDPGEMTDAREEQPEVLADLGGIAARWRKSGLGATGSDGDDSWKDTDATVLQRLKDLGYAE